MSNSKIKHYTLTDSFGKEWTLTMKLEQRGSTLPPQDFRYGSSKEECIIQGIKVLHSWGKEADLGLKKKRSKK